MNDLPELTRLRDLLDRNVSLGEKNSYFVPSLWIQNDLKKPSFPLQFNPYAFFANQIDKIINSDPVPLPEGKAGEWSRNAIVYNMMVRLSTAYDHNRNGELRHSANSDGFRETGTFLKSIALLPYLQRMGFNTVHLLPITQIGADGRKGHLGSPYAIRNPYELDERLAEPLLDISVEAKFKAFVEAAHHLGMRVVLEFVFRTAARDSDWVKDHPDWFYWIKESVEEREPGSRDPAKYGSPVFSADELGRIHSKVAAKDFSDSVPPPESYRAMFTPPPTPDRVQREGVKWVGVLEDGTRVIIPGAFADWPPEDAQPPWGDVTYLKLYDHPDFNYIAYNTIRMYDHALAREENAKKDLWNAITGIIPHYVKNFGIDGVMVDMGHALPLPLLQDIVKRGREANPDLAFWEENFGPTQDSRDHGYNAALGYIWIDLHLPHKAKDLVARYSRERFPVLFFGTPESHNSPRAAARPGGAAYSRFAYALSAFLPLMPCVHSGFELMETWPVNTGLDFTPDEAQRYPTSKLALFSESTLSWNRAGTLCAWIKHINDIRRQVQGIVSDPDPASFKWLESGHENAVAFERVNPQGRLFVAANLDMSAPMQVRLALPSEKKSLPNLISGKDVWREDTGVFVLDLPAGGVAALQEA